MGIPAGLQIPLTAPVPVGGSVTYPIGEAVDFATFVGAVTLAGDATGPANANTVAKVNGVAVPATPAPGQVLQAVDATHAQWADTSTPSPSIPFANFQAHHVLWYSGFDVPGQTTASGWKLIQSAGTAAAVAPSAGSKLNGSRRSKYTVTSGTSQLGVFEGYNGAGGFYIWRGDAAGRGGFFLRSRFAVVSSGAGSQWYHHHGVGNFAGSPGFTDYTTNTTVARVMLVQSYTANASSVPPPGTTWKISECDGTTNTLTDTGVPIVHGNLVELILSCAPNGAIQWTVNDLTAGLSQSGQCVTSPPTVTTFLCPALHSAINVAGTGTCELDVVNIYCEMFD